MNPEREQSGPAPTGLAGPGPGGAAGAQPGEQVGPGPRAGPVPSEEGKRLRGGLTIRAKLTLWYGGVFLLAGIVLIAVNFFLVKDSLTPAPEKARAVIAERYDIPQQLLEYRGGPGLRGQMPRYVTINGVPVPRLIEEVQHEMRDEALRQLWGTSIVALAIMAVLTFGLAWLLAGRMLRPLHAITGTARRLSESTLHERIDLKGPRDELKELADTFDAMLARLDTAFTAQREFVSNASHELRTPLTIIRTEIDVALSDPDLSKADLREMGAAVTEAVDRSERLIDSLLVLARADSSLARTALDLQDLVREQAEASTAAAQKLGLRSEFRLGPAPIEGDRALMERLVGNLIENAVSHNVPGGWFSAQTFTAGDRAVLEVAGAGSLLPQEDLERLLERFYRADRSRSRRTGGFGLGLSIVKSVAAAHGGTVQLAAVPDGGLRVTVNLPARHSA